MQAHAPWSNGNIYWDTAGCCNGGTQRINADATDNQVWEEWNHYAFVKSGSFKAIYVNGELFHEGDNTAPLPTDITYLNVGGDQNGNKCAVRLTISQSLLQHLMRIRSMQSMKVIVPSIRRSRLILH